MFRYILRRVLYAVPILIGVSLLTFMLFYLVTTPEQLARRNINSKNPTPKQLQQWLHDHGYDKPRSEQFKEHMTSLLTLNFGKSDATGEPISDILRRGVGPSALVASMIFVVTLAVTLSAAILNAYFRGTYVDTALTFLSVFLMSVSSLVYVIGVQFIFGKVLKYAPLTGFQPGMSEFKFVLLPIIIGVLGGFGGSVRMYRTFLLDEMNQDYVRTARAKGVSERLVLLRHVLKAALIPFITSTVSAIPFLILGNLVIENFFGIPGLGSTLQDAISGQDFAVVRAMVFLGAFLYIIGLILTDIAYALADPRVRLE